MFNLIKALVAAIQRAWKSNVHRSQLALHGEGK